MASAPEVSKSRAEEVFRLANALYQDHRDVLVDTETEALQRLRTRMTDILSPYPVGQLDAEVRDLNEKFPDREHGCHTHVVLAA
ncbi:MAG: hypothetical protein JO345_03540 [Streptosporangiaceae bacterium]|nr:hypothetical protein [Streptosporangiaceae bacterium]